MKLSNIAKGCVTLSFPAIFLVLIYCLIDALTEYTLPKENYLYCLGWGGATGIPFTLVHFISEGIKDTL